MPLGEGYNGARQGQPALAFRARLIRDLTGLLAQQYRPSVKSNNTQGEKHTVFNRSNSLWTYNTKLLLQTVFIKYA